MTEFVEIVTTTANREEAQRIAQDLVARKLAACVQVAGPVTSVYWWQGALETAEEWQLAIKTRRELYAAVEATIHELHSYEVPQILAFPVLEGSRRYLDWLAREATGTHPV